MRNQVGVSTRVVCILVYGGGDFCTLLTRALAYFFGHTLVQKRGKQSEVCIVVMYMLDKLHNRSPFPTKIRVFRYPVILAKLFVACGVNFVGERKLSTGSPQIIIFATFNNCGHSWDEKKKAWIPPVEEYRLWKHDISSFHSIKKTNSTGIGTSSL